MTTRSAFLFLSIWLLAGIVVITDGAIDCYQCENCADADKLKDSDIKGCKQSTFQELAGKLGITTQHSGKAESCFKIAIKNNNQNTVSRGCSVKGRNECSTKTDPSRGEATVCVCNGNGCNSAPASVTPHAITFCSLFLLALLFV